ncbi:MAG: hypothetical protein ACYDCK_12510 [Thermoplasmatota archaeon]
MRAVLIGFVLIFSLPVLSASPAAAGVNRNDSGANWSLYPPPPPAKHAAAPFHAKLVPVDHLVSRPPAWLLTGPSPDSATNQKVGIDAEKSGCDAWFLWWCTDSWDNTHVNGVESQISTAVATGGSCGYGDCGVSRWPGLVTGSNDFIQIGYQTDNLNYPGKAVLFVQVYEQGHFNDACNTTYVVCLLDSTPLSGYHSYYLKSGVNGNANTWGFYLDSDSNLVYSITLGSSDSGGNEPYTFLERTDTTWTTPSSSWNAAIYQLKGGSWGTPRHVDFATQGSPPCPAMGFTAVGYNEDNIGNGEGCSYTPGQRIW